MPQKTFPRGELAPEQEATGPAHSRVAFDTLESAKAYQEWKRAVPVLFRGLVESAIMTGVSAVRETGLPRVDAFLRAASIALTSLRVCSSR